MKPFLWLLLGIILLLVESSLFFAPFLLAWVWLVSKFLPVERTIWLVFLLGVVLDVILLAPLGRSSLVLLLLLFAFWYERQLFASSIRVDLAALVLALCFWAFWQKMSLWVVCPVAVLAAVTVRIFQPSEMGVILRR